MQTKTCQISKNEFNYQSKKFGYGKKDFIIGNYRYYKEGNKYFVEPKPKMSKKQLFKHNDMGFEAWKYKELLGYVIGIKYQGIEHLKQNNGKIWQSGDPKFFESNTKAKKEFNSLPETINKRKVEKICRKYWYYHN